MRYLLSVFLLFTSLNIFAQNPELYHRVKINTGKDGLVNLARAGIAVDHGTYKKGIYFITDLSESEIQAVKQAGFTYTVLIEDVSTYYRKRNEKKARKSQQEQTAALNVKHLPRH